MTCSRCGADVPRQTVSQRRCVPCDKAVAAIVAQDAARRTPRYPAKDMSGWAR